MKLDKFLYAIAYIGRNLFIILRLDRVRSCEIDLFLLPTFNIYKCRWFRKCIDYN